MIPRYSRAEMTSIWEPENPLSIWFKIEAHAATASAEIGIIPKAAAKKIWDKGSAATFDIARIDEIEASHETRRDRFFDAPRRARRPRSPFYPSRHDVVGRARYVPERSVVRAADLLIADIDRLLAALKTRAFEHKNTLTIGRSHGIHAEPTTFGIKLAYAYAEFQRDRERMVAAEKRSPTCAISGAVGTYAISIRASRTYVAEKMGLVPGAGLDADHPARPSRHVFCDARCRSRPAWSAWRSRSGTCSGRRFLKPKNTSRPGRRADRRCRTSATRCFPKT